MSSSLVLSRICIWRFDTWWSASNFKWLFQALKITSMRSGIAMTLHFPGGDLTEERFEEALESRIETQGDGLPGGIVAVGALDAGGQVIVGGRAMRALLDEGG